MKVKYLKQKKYGRLLLQLNCVYYQPQVTDIVFLYVCEREMKLYKWKSHPTDNSTSDVNESLNW